MALLTRLPPSSPINISELSCLSIAAPNNGRLEEVHRFVGEAVEGMPSLVASSSMVLLPG